MHYIRRRKKKKREKKKSSDAGEPERKDEASLCQLGFH
jgi:hypothetical protein